MRISTARQAIGAASAKSTAERLQVFQKCRARIRPVMHYFFLEQSCSPMVWFQMRLNYGRSVAASSLVGHIMGIGDRHVSNILIDKSAGELVHIDFGYAFDQVC